MSVRECVCFGGKTSGKMYSEISKKFEEIIDKYITASQKFNLVNESYKCKVFLNFNTLDIYIEDLKRRKNFKFQILIHLINDLTEDEIVNCYEELLTRVKEGGKK